MYRSVALLVVRGGLEVLGPAGLYLTRSWGAAAMPALAGILLVWVAVPLAAAAWRLERKGGLA